MSLLSAIDGAELVLVESELGLVFAWFGGQGVNVYREDGVEVDYFTMGGARKPTRAVVAAAIRRHIAALYEEES